MNSRVFPSPRAHARRLLPSASRQGGVMLIEALCAILIFSFGVLGLIGLQAKAASQSSDAKYRSAAAELADQLINQVWVSDRTANNIATTKLLFVSSPAQGNIYKVWLGNASTQGTVMGTLPGVTATANLPTVSFGAPAPAGCTSTSATCSIPVTVTMNWASPQDTSNGVVHSYTASAQISLY